VNKPIRPRILTGDRPTGPLHIGHYFGSLRDRVALQGEYETYLLIADGQALTDNAATPEKVRDNVGEVALDYLAAGIDPERTSIVLQSRLPAVAELTVYFMNLVTVARVGRNPTVKEEITQKGLGDSVPLGFFAYPVSQAADILAFNADLVPVGADQLPMIEQAREIARTFNRTYGEVFREPSPRVGSGARVRGLDGGSKMGKSLNNALYLKDGPDTVAAKVMSAYTDPEKARAADPGRPAQCPVFVYHELFAPERSGTVRNDCLAGRRGCVACKRELIAAVDAFLLPIRTRRNKLEGDPAYIRDILRKGTEAGRFVTERKLEEAKKAMKIDYSDFFGH
jgi:tryptophanyl-tRNA synthetase